MDVSYLLYGIIIEVFISGISNDIEICGIFFFLWWVKNFREYSVLIEF